MKKEIADMWCAALRSGEYNQGRGFLCSESERGKEYCCLGVLCDLYNKHNPPLSMGSIEGSVGGILFDGCLGDLPEAVIKWSGMSSRNGMRCLGIKPSLIGLNDDCGFSFIEIANVIEEEWEAL